MIMGLLLLYSDKKWRKEDAAAFFGGKWCEIFRIVTTALLSLLLPLSFLLLARLSTAHYLLAVAGNFSIRWPEPSGVVSFLFLYANSTVLYFLISLISVSAFVHVFLNGRVTISFFSSRSSWWSSPVPRRLYAAWILLFMLQLCVGLGLEGSIIAGIDGTGFNRETNLVSRVIFFLGLHETMRFWSKSVVKPVVDDTVTGGCCCVEEKWAERVAMAVGFGSIWWWRLRDEIDSLVVVAELKRELPEGVAMVDFVGWWLYHLTVSVGFLRILKSVVWLAMLLLFRKVEEEEAENNTARDHHNYQEIDEKV